MRFPNIGDRFCFILVITRAIIMTINKKILATGKTIWRNDLTIFFIGNVKTAYRFYMKLSELKKGETATVVGIKLKGKELKRLNDMGLTEGVTVRIIRFSVMGDPVEISLRGFDLALRMSTADSIIVEKTERKSK